LNGSSGANQAQTARTFCTNVSSFSAEEPILRKASAHGLGHLRPAYGVPEDEGDEDEDEDVGIGVAQWQADFWSEIVRAALRQKPDEVRLDWHPSVQAPAASRYAATTPKLLKSFDSYNMGKQPTAQVRPFNFMLWFHAKEPARVAAEGHDIGWTKRTRKPKPVAPFEWWLQTYAEALRGYVRHPETKFVPTERGYSGPLQRRHVHVSLIQFIGKEADRWEEDARFGADEDPAIEHDLSAATRADAAGAIHAVLAAKACTHATLARAAKVSEHTIRAVLDGDPSVDGRSVAKLLQAADRFAAVRASRDAEISELLDWARERVKEEGLSAFAGRIGYDAMNPAEGTCRCTVTKSWPSRPTQEGEGLVQDLAAQCSSHGSIRAKIANGTDT
jgi:hypothetical protein